MPLCIGGVHRRRGTARCGVTTSINVERRKEAIAAAIQHGRRGRTGLNALLFDASSMKLLAKRAGSWCLAPPPQRNFPARTHRERDEPRIALSGATSAAHGSKRK